MEWEGGCVIEEVEEKGGHVKLSVGFSIEDSSRVCWSTEAAGAGQGILVYIMYVYYIYICIIHTMYNLYYIRYVAGFFLSTSLFSILLLSLCFFILALIDASSVILPAFCFMCCDDIGTYP